MAEIRGMQFPRESRLFNEKDRAVLRYVELATRAAAAIPEGVLDEMRSHFSAEELVDLTLVICLANMTNRFNDALQVESDLGSREDTGSG